MTSGDQSPVDGAARWLAAKIDHMPNVIGILRQRFGLSTVQAAQACTLANKYRRHVTDCDVTSVTRDVDSDARCNVTPATLSAPKGAA